MHKNCLWSVFFGNTIFKIAAFFLFFRSASLFYIAKDEENSKLNFFAKRKIITVLLDAMDLHAADSTMMRNSCLTICQFRIPQDIDSVSFNFFSVFDNSELVFYHKMGSAQNI